MKKGEVLFASEDDVKVPQHEHILKFHRRDRGYTCDMCNSSFSGGGHTYFCSACDFDACLACASKFFPQPGKSQSDSQPAKSSKDRSRVVKLSANSEWPKVFIRSDEHRHGKKAIGFFGNVAGALEYCQRVSGEGRRNRRMSPDEVSREFEELLSRKITNGRSRRSYAMSLWEPTILKNQKQVDGHAKMEDIYEREINCESGGFSDPDIEDELKADADYILGMMKSWVQVEEDEHQGASGCCPLTVCKFEDFKLSDQKYFVLETLKVWVRHGDSDVLGYCSSELKADKGFVLDLLDILAQDEDFIRRFNEGEDAGEDACWGGSQAEDAVADEIVALHRNDPDVQARIRELTESLDKGGGGRGRGGGSRGRRPAMDP
jgi:hypothetical protein